MMTPGRRLALIQGGLAAVLTLLAGAESLGVGSGYRLLPAISGGASNASLPPMHKDSFTLENYASKYSQVIERPVFNEDRKPTPADASTAVGSDQPATPLAISLTGVILSGELQMALLRDNSTNKPLRIRLGTPLEGQQSAWKLVELKPRSAIFESQGQRQELSLATFDKAIAAPVGAAPAAPPNPGQGQVPPTAQNPAAPVDPLYGQFGNGSNPAAASASAAAPSAAPNADEIRRRIEERRRQLREEAQKMSQQQ